jgi:hypothetical protein
LLQSPATCWRREVRVEALQGDGTRLEITVELAHCGAHLFACEQDVMGNFALAVSGIAACAELLHKCAARVDQDIDVDCPIGG